VTDNVQKEDEVLEDKRSTVPTHFLQERGYQPNQKKERRSSLILDKVLMFNEKRKRKK
jgi:hypothetical protein